jgi:hypothetical protein
MPLDPARDPHRRGDPIDGHHPECAVWVVSGRRHLLLEPSSWSESSVLMAAAA